MKGIIYFILLCTFQLNAQSSWELLFQSGKVVRNYPRFPDRDAAALLKASWNKTLAGSAPWHQYYSYPELTVQGMYGSLGNRKQLGMITGATAGFRFSRNAGIRWTLTAEGCFGAAFFNKPFDEFTNYDNVTIGTRITALASADAGVMYHLNPFWSVILRGSILHSSNSHYSLPNVGINLPMVSAGVRFRPNPATVIMSAREAGITDKKPKVNVRLALGINEQGGATGPVNGPKYAVYLASAYIYRHYTPVARWTTGLEAYYNNGVHAYITTQKYYKSDERLRSASLLYILGHEYIFGNIGFVTQGGLYLYNPFARSRFEDINGNTKDFLRTVFTARLGFQYYVFNTFLRKHKSVFVGWYVKTNFGKADFMEVGAGYNF